MTLFRRKRPEHLVIYCDGAIGAGERGSGAGVVVRDGEGQVVGLVKQTLPPLTNTQAEYASLTLALRSAWHFRPRRLTIYMDSDVVVGQMQGRYTVRSPALKCYHAEACRLARRFRQVTYVHIPREKNRLADALAVEALRDGVGEPSNE